MPSDAELEVIAENPAIAQKRIREIAATSDRIKWSHHALDRMNEREIYDVDVLMALRSGTFGMRRSGRNEASGSARYIIYRLRGSRDLGVVVIILKTDDLLVKTVEWEDLR